MTEPLDPENPLWRFSLAVYAQPGVREECLAVQDALGADINLLLFCAWLGATRGVRLTAAQHAAAMEAVAGWHAAAVRPLRAVRRGLKTRPEHVAALVQDLRQRVAADELRAEQVEQALLYAHADAAGLPAGGDDAAACVRANVDGYLRPLGGSAEACPALCAAAVHG